MGSNRKESNIAIAILKKKNNLIPSQTIITTASRFVWSTIDISIVGRLITIEPAKEKINKWVKSDNFSYCNWKNNNYYIGSNRKKSIIAIAMLKKITI